MFSSQDFGDPKIQCTVPQAQRNTVVQFDRDNDDDDGGDDDGDDADDDDDGDDDGSDEGHDDDVDMNVKYKCQL